MATPAKLTDLDYIQFLLAAHATFSCVEAAKTDGAPDQPPAHDAYTRLLTRQPPDTEALWTQAQPFVRLKTGLLVVDDSTLDKPHATHMDLVHRHWSGKHKRVVWGISLITLLWTDGGAKLPVDCRLNNEPVDALNQNQHFRDMLKTAHERGFCPRYVCSDSGYSGLANLKTIRSYGWLWLMRFKSNRAVDPDDSGNRQIYLLNIPAEGWVVHLRGYGMMRVFAIVSEDPEEVGFWATNDLSMTEATRQQVADEALAIEEYHRGLKQCCGVEGCPARTERSQRNHIVWSMRAFIRLERQRLQSGLSWYESKKCLLRHAIRAYRARPTLTLSSTA